jgi:hypothetical protein
MDRRDQDLLDRQLAHLNPPPRRDGTMMLAIVGGISRRHDGWQFPVRP